MLPVLEAQRRKRLFFALRLDHDVCFPTGEGIQHRVPVSEIDRVGVRP